MGISLLMLLNQLIVYLALQKNTLLSLAKNQRSCEAWIFPFLFLYCNCNNLLDKTPFVPLSLVKVVLFQFNNEDICRVYSFCPFKDYSLLQRENIEAGFDMRHKILVLLSL